MINEKQLMEELAVLEVQQETSSDLVSENYKNYDSDSDSITIQGYRLYRKTRLNNDTIAQLYNFMEAVLCESILSGNEVINLADFYKIEIDLDNDEIWDQEAYIYQELSNLVSEYHNSIMPGSEKVGEEETRFEKFSDNYDEEHAELEARLQREKATPGNNINVSKASNGRDSIEMMVLGLI